MGGFITRKNNQTVYWMSINGMGNLYESSQEQKEGFVPHMNETTRSISYWREYPNGVQGYIDDIRIVTKPNKQGINMSVFQIRIRDYDGNNDFMIRFPLITQKGGLNRYVKSFTKYFSNIDLTKEVNFDSFKRKPGDEYPPSNLMIAYAPENPGEKAKMVDFYFKNGVNGWPDAEKEIDMMGNEKKSYKTQDTFAMQCLTQYIDYFQKNIADIRMKVKADRERRGLPFMDMSGTETSSTPSQQVPGQQAPINPVQQPVGPVQQPVNPVQAPVNPVQQPVNPVQAPVQQPPLFNQPAPQQAPVFNQDPDIDDLPF